MKKTKRHRYTQTGCGTGGGITMSYLRRMSTSIPPALFNSKEIRAAKKEKSKRKKRRK
jgi:hypothetical protein